MLWLPGPSRFESSLASGNDYGDVITHSGSANTKGSWVELIASTWFQACGMFVSIDQGSNPFLVDIGIGGSGSEKVLLQDIPHDPSQKTAYTGPAFYIPCRIPAGSRLSARQQNNNTLGTCTVRLVLVGGDEPHFDPPQRWTTLGSLTATSLGTAVDPGGVAHTKGSWVQFSSSLPHPVRWMVFIGWHNGNSVSSRRMRFDIGVGANPNEKVIVPDLLQTYHATGDDPIPATYSFPVGIPAGVALSVRAQS